MAAPSITSELRELQAGALARIRQGFGSVIHGRSAVRQRTELVDTIALRLWKEFISSDLNGPAKLALVAIGGYGRGILFPHSDIDILFLYDGNGTEKKLKDEVRRFSQEMWDLKLRLSPQQRTVSECDQLDPDNLEFTISLLDCRYLAGDRELFTRLHESTVPRLVMRESQLIVQRLAQVTQTRHAKYGNTIFHLEPNIKDGPGGLRDYNVVHWLSLVSALERNRYWPNQESLISLSVRAQFDSALDYLLSVRCFLHFRHGRDDNTLSWEAQVEAAGRAIGMENAEARSPEEWMRIYFRHAKSIHKVATQLLEEIPAARSSLYREFQNWRSRLSNSNFSVVNGFILLQQPGGVKDPDLLLSMFCFMAQHGLKLSTATEQRIEQVNTVIASHIPRGSDIWKHLRELLAAPYAADALRAMHHLQLLTLFLPELRPIDSLVIRDYYHRFTVDEHSFLAIESLHRLRKPQSDWERRFGELLGELEQPELLFMALLLHDVGKGLPGTDHVQASLDVAWKCLARLQLAPPDRETVYFLIANHLEVSAALRKDIFDPNTIRAFAEKMGTPERLKMLCLLTYADIKSVNPEALTPWKAENIWQLYIAATNQLNRSVDQERVHSDVEDENLARVRALAPTLGKKLKGFLEGLPQRYLKTYPAEAILSHVEMANALGADPAQLDLKRGRHWFELTLVTADRPALFAKVAGVLSAWGMNIVKANAVSNSAGVIIDTFYFTDRFRTLELNLPEWERFKRSVSDVLCGEVDLDRLMRDRLRADKNGIAKVKVATQIEFDDKSSTHSTLVQVIAQDRPGLLHRISSTLSYQKCNIEIALIDTEGQTAIDVFYLTSGGAKLTAAHQERLRKALSETLVEQ
ncbi:MAG: [protein-PII] uridylyltransferase [Acidobacteria bacterium]|nr:MAG: [protein-PII] uridylyltransferase [Acidobacteriota bacterium]